MKAEFVKKTQKEIEVFAIENDNGMRVELITYGARISKLLVPDKNGVLTDVFAGFENEDDFMGDNPYFNAVIGRVANRIGGASFELDGKRYDLFKNDGDNALHGGECGFDSRMWQAQIIGDDSVKMSRVSQDGEEGYPGNLSVSVTYTLTQDNALELKYEAICDQNTLCALTNHAYFNLDGKFETVLDHEVYIDSNYVTTVDDNLIPHGEMKEIKGGAFDFSEPKKIGKDIKAKEHMLEIAKGYDFNYVLNGKGERKVASAYCQNSGIEMSVYTDRACMQFYTGNFLDGLKGKKTYNYQSAFCMETQGYPNACNVPSFESATLEKGKTYTAYTKYKFDIK